MPTAAEYAAMTDDQFQAFATREAAMAIGDWLMASVNLKRPIRSLTAFELECLATAAISRWIVCRSERMMAGHSDPGLTNDGFLP